MAIELPTSPKVYTTVYDNFKGVDFTNDSTNVWRRRSPSGLNMLPDPSGRPFKRHGWEVMITNEELSDRFGVTSCNITKCNYFELAGQDHVVIFTDSGVMFYHGDADNDIVNTDFDCFSGHDRCFFFEGNGVSAFYIYGNYRVWKYWYDGDFHLTEVTDDLHIPTVLIGTTADGVGTTYDAYNMLGSQICVQYHDADLFTYWGTDGLVFTVADGFKTGKTQGSPAMYRWMYDAPITSWEWNITGQTSVSFDSANISVASPRDYDELFIIYCYGVVLPNNVALAQYEKVSVWSSTSTQFDTEIEVITTGTPTTGQALLHIDGVTDRADKHAWLEFNPSQTFADLGQEDIIKVIMPSNSVSATTKTISAFTDTATLIGEVVV